MSKIGKFEIHELCMMFPWMEPETMQVLKNDIKKHGQRDTIKLYQGKILDGKNRMRACIDLDLIPKTEELPEDTNPIAYVKAVGLCRRDLHLWQRYQIAKKLREYEEEQLSPEEKLRIEKQTKELLANPIKKDIYLEEKARKIAPEAKSTPKTIRKIFDIEERIEDILTDTSKDIEPIKKKAISIKKRLETDKISVDNAHTQIKNIEKQPSKIDIKIPTIAELQEEIKVLKQENNSLTALNRRIIAFVKNTELWESFKLEFNIKEEPEVSYEPTPKELREAELL